MTKKKDPERATLNSSGKHFFIELMSSHFPKMELIKRIVHRAESALKMYMPLISFIMRPKSIQKQTTASSSVLCSLRRRNGIFALVSMNDD